VNAATAASELFPHVRIVMGMVVGLGITRILMGLAGIIQHRTRPRLSLIHLLWAGSVLLELVFFWWWEFELSTIDTWSFGIFFFLILYSVTLFLLGALLFPDKLDGYAGYEDFFLQRRHWFFGVFAVTFVLDIIDTLIKGAPYFDGLGLGYVIQIPIVIALCLIGIWTSDRRYHLGLVLAHIAYQLFWIAGLFTMHT
jgi:hypothetical protein